MLVLKIKSGSSVLLGIPAGTTFANHTELEVKVLKIDNGDVARLGIAAPLNIAVARKGANELHSKNTTPSVLDKLRATIKATQADGSPENWHCLINLLQQLNINV